MVSYKALNTYVGMEFAQEIDLDDDSEMEAYLNS